MMQHNFHLWFFVFVFGILIFGLKEKKNVQDYHTPPRCNSCNICNLEVYYCHQSNHSLGPDVWSWVWCGPSVKSQMWAWHWLMGQSLLCTLMSQPKQFCAQLLAWTLTLADTCKIASKFSVGANRVLVREKVILASADIYSFALPLVCFERIHLTGVSHQKRMWCCTCCFWLPTAKEYLGDDISCSSLNIKVEEFEQWIQNIIARVHALGELSWDEEFSQTCITFGPPG